MITRKNNPKKSKGYILFTKIDVTKVHNQKSKKLNLLNARYRGCINIPVIDKTNIAIIKPFVPIF